MNKKFSWRAFISFGLLITFIIISLTGIILYFAPAGKIAHWINWKFAGLTKNDWQAIHTIFSSIFLILSVFHLFSINWKVFVSYIKHKTRQGLNKKKELILSLILTILIFCGVLYPIPPFSTIMDFGETLTKSWENAQTKPPIPHAELLSLTEISEKIDNLTIETAIKRLNTKKIKINNPDQKLSEIGALNNISPNDIYKVITEKSPSKKTGNGMGRKTLEEFADEENKGIETLLKILKEKGISARGKQTFREIADNNNKSVKNIYELIK